MSLYLDENGVEITTHSMLQSFSRCPNKAKYEYHERLKPRILTTQQKPLERGTWFHTLLEDYYAGRDWKETHKTLCGGYNRLFDEEKEALGDLPQEMVTLMRAYLWHYGANKEDPYHGWNVLETEIKLECEWPDGNGIYRCKIDAIVEDIHTGEVIIVDHKTHNQLPDHTYRLLDHASIRYLWCAQKNGYPVTRFIWNYIKAKAPTKPNLVDKGRRLSKVNVETDYPTYLRAILEYGLDPKDYKEKLKYLKAQRWEVDKIQTSPFFRRDPMEKDPGMLATVLAASMRTRDRMNSYLWDESTERVVDKSCGWCPYRDLCTTELFAGNAELIRRRNYRKADPMAYYKDS